MTVWSLFAVLAALAASALLPGFVQAASEAVPQLAAAENQGVVNTRAFHALPEEMLVAVLPEEDTDINMRLAARFEAGLDAAAVATDQTGPIKLYFSSRTITGDFAVKPGTLGSVGGSSDRGVDVIINLWSSSKDSVLGGRQADSGSRRQNFFHINAVLRDTANGQLLWQGDAYCPLTHPDPERVTPSMVEALVRALGRTAKNEPFTVP